MADAAYAIFSKDSKKFTANFCIDDEILRGEGVTNFNEYSYVPNAQLILDFFLDDPGTSKDITKDFHSIPVATLVARTTGGVAAVNGSRPFTTDAPKTGADAKPAVTDPQLEATFKAIEGLIGDDLVKSIGGLFQFELKGGSSFVIDLKKSPGWAGLGQATGKPDVVMTLDAADFIKMFAGKLNPTSAFMSGKLKIKGDLGLAMKLEKLLKKTQAKL